MSSAPDDAPRENPEHDASERAAALPNDPAAGDAVLGRVVAGRYTVEQRIGTGSIGRTFRAKRAPEDDLVALKLVHPKLTAEEKFQRRLTRDVDAARKLEHRHIARIFEQGTDPTEGAYLCRELVDGEDLISAARRAPLTPRRICDLLMQVLSALSEAHRHGVLHRNLKPHNVLVTRSADGREHVKVCDFGNPQRARAGAEYMAPEQADGSAIDGQADVYAVGVMLYELLTDDVPFRGSTPRDTLALHASELLLTPHDKRPDRAVPRELEAVCVKALAKAPADRHRSPREMSQALRAVVSLLGPRADEPLGSSVFADPNARLADEDAGDRITMPGEQLRSRTKFWLGAGLLAAVCVGVLLNPQTDVERTPEALPPEAIAAARLHGEEALESGLAKLHAGDPAGAVTQLRNARRALGDRPEVLRALGEALVVNDERTEGASLLVRYLELDPNANDREFVRSLIRRDEQAP